MKHTLRRRPSSSSQPPQVKQATRRARRMQELFRIEQALELTRPEPDAAHLRYIQDQLAALEDAVISLETC